MPGLRGAAELGDLIAASDVDKRSYSKKNLPNWLDKVTQWAMAPQSGYRIAGERYAGEILL